MKKILYFIGPIAFLIAVYFVSVFVLENQNQFSIDDNNQSLREKENENFVYETEVESASDCASFELYDEERKVCSFECANESECAEMEKLIDQEFSSWTDELEKDTGKVEEKAIASNDKSLRAEYSVASGERISLTKGKDNEKYKSIWQEISDLSPDSLSDNYIDTFQIFENNSDDTLAFVDDEDMDGKWRVAVNLSGYNSSTERENKSTFIHELAHIISLNSSQVNPNIEKNDCNTFHVDEGCAKSSSYLNIFQSKFWAGQNKNAQGGLEFSKDKFVTEYASTNEVEDLAESFAFFVLSSEGLDDSLEKNQKINSFYNYSELVSMRKDMRKVLSADIVRAKKSSTSN